MGRGEMRRMGGGEERGREEGGRGRRDDLIKDFLPRPNLMVSMCVCVHACMCVCVEGRGGGDWKGDERGGKERKRESLTE